jgi:Flp pilus assembly protein TadG
MTARRTRSYAAWPGRRTPAVVLLRQLHQLTARWSTLRRRLGPAGSGDRGQIGVLALGLFVLATLLVLGAVDVTAAQLARMRLLDAADSAALDAADALDERAAYEGGVLDQLTLTDESVAQAAGAHLARTPMPPGITAWSVVPDTGTSDGATAVVTLQGTATLPMSGWVLESLGGSVTITVTSRARAPLR